MLGGPAAANVLGRKCGPCTMCCKIMEIPEVETEKNSWCRHCQIGKGCSIYKLRPARCQAFLCGYLAWDIVPDYWFPAKSKIVIVNELDGRRIAFHVDASVPSRWKQHPYYDDIKSLAIRALNDDCQVLVCIGFRAIAILPDRDVDLGRIDPDERIVTAQRADQTWDAFKLHKDDPRIAMMQVGVPFYG